MEAGPGQRQDDPQAPHYQGVQLQHPLEAWNPGHWRKIRKCTFPYDLLKRLTFQLNDPITVTIVLTRTWTRLKFHTTVLITVGVTCPHLGLAVVLFAHVTSQCSQVSSCDDMMFSGVSTLLDWNCLGKYWPLSHCTFVHTASNRWTVTVQTVQQAHIVQIMDCNKSFTYV